VWAGATPPSRQARSEAVRLEGEGRLVKGLTLALVLVALWAALFYWSNYTLDGQVDGCLDDGGRWNYEQGKCEGNRSAP
jgi:hypothetical protein